MVLFDTCALLWTTLDPGKLTEKEFHAAAKELNAEAYISSISVWEIGIKVQKGKLDLKMTLEEYLRMLKKLGTLTILPVDEKIWLENLRLDWTHRDPVDRTIVATARLNDFPIITKDKLIKEFYPKIIW